MKLLLESWKRFLNEEKKGAYSFDYDETLIKYKPDPEDPQFSVLYDKPHEENIAKLRELAAAGETVYIVTSRSKRTGEKFPWDTAPDPEDLIADMETHASKPHRRCLQKEMNSYSAYLKLPFKSDHIHHHVQRQIRKHKLPVRIVYEHRESLKHQLYFQIP